MPAVPAAPDASQEKHDELRRAALEYHEFPTPGKIAVSATKQLTNQRDLGLAYTPGVAAPCDEIVKDPNAAFKYTSRGNLVAVITNGTAVLGLGNIGPLAAKPVMEGKAVLFKKFAGIDVFDIEIDETDPAKLVDIIASLEPTFGAINLEDIRAPDCFYVERELRKRMKIPVFHDDQHGTAITVGAAMLNALKVVGKDPKQVKLVTSGAGAAAPDVPVWVRPLSSFSSATASASGLPDSTRASPPSSRVSSSWRRGLPVPRRMLTTRTPTACRAIAPSRWPAARVPSGSVRVASRSWSSSLTVLSSAP